MVCAGHLLVISRSAHPGALPCLTNRKYLALSTLYKTFHKQLLTFSMSRLCQGNYAFKPTRCWQNSRNILSFCKLLQCFAWTPTVMIVYPFFFFFFYISCNQACEQTPSEQDSITDNSQQCLITLSLSLYRVKQMDRVALWHINLSLTQNWLQCLEWAHTAQ